MTYEKYLMLCEQMGKEPKEEEIPISTEDLPPIVHKAINIFNTLNDRIVSDVGYLGKDYTLLPTLIRNSSEKDLLIEIVVWLDKKHIAKSQELMERERKKLKQHGSKGHSSI